MKKSIYQICLLVGLLFLVNQNFAVNSLPNAKVEQALLDQSQISLENHVGKISKKGNFVKRLVKKRLIKKLNKRFKKAKKANRNGLLSDGRIYWGLILLLAGLLVGILLASWLSWIGYLATVAGLILVIWGLIDMAA